MPELSELMASHQGLGHVVAPAGYGKTYLIAQAVCRSNGRQLVLTHTYAGVNALRRKMRDLSVPSSTYQIDTIASWALRLSLSYKDTSGWLVERPSNSEWGDMYAACARLLDESFIRRIVRASYAGMYVDEYQDCSIAQHNIVLKLARDLPCRVLGDPLQSIFDFDGQTSVDWAQDVGTSCEPIGQLETPHRWNLAGSPQLGKWLQGVRQRLETGQAIDLTQGRPPGVTFRLGGNDSELMRAQANACRYFECDPNESVIAIHKGDQLYKSKCHVLAKNLSGKFSSIEEIEGKTLFSFIENISEAKTGKKRLKSLIEFSEKCMTSVGANLSDASKRGELVEVRSKTKNPDLARLANAYLADSTSANMSRFLLGLKALADVRVVRADLFNRALGVLRKHMLHPELRFIEAAEKYHGEFRYKGRPVGHRKLIGTTLLVKGLEFHHAIVLDAASLSRNELYVALTRGAKSLTIVSTASTLNPKI